jgi:hypothetical protein
MLQICSSIELRRYFACHHVQLCAAGAAVAVGKASRHFRLSARVGKLGSMKAALATATRRLISINTDMVGR